MKASRTLIALCLLPLGVCGVAIAQQTMTFSNTTPPVTVTLSPSSTLGIAPNGNVTASCVLATGANGNQRCNGMPEPGLGLPPTPSLTVSFSGAADGGGLYNPGTIATITPVFGTGPAAEACVLLYGAGSTTAAGWSGAITPPFTARQVTLAAASSTYRFKIRCLSLGGAADWAGEIVASTNAGIIIPPPPPPDGCSAAQQTLADNSHPGYTRVGSPATIPDLRTFAGQACGDFPNSGSPVCLMLGQRNFYMALRFTAPPIEQGLYGSNFIEWSQAQVGGEALTNNSYVSITKCPGDFTIPGDAASASSTDPTYSDGCRNIQRALLGNSESSLGIAYNLFGVSTPGSCGITPGQVYYLNFILADPRGGIQQGEHTCVNPNLSQCGFQIRAQ